MFCIHVDHYPLSDIKKELGEWLSLEGEFVRVPEWQSLDVRDRPQASTIELQNVAFTTPIPETMEDAVLDVEPNLPWAEEHFLERVSGIPYNPPPSHVNWPFAQSGNEEHIKNTKFSHTYPERMWPKLANDGIEDPMGGGRLSHYGIRFEYGDLSDVVNQLRKSPMTRQAYLPIWFPEDTGAVHGERVPCTLGYHFLIREGRLNVTYFIRSCDFVRHFQDDVYLAMRLGQWVRVEASKRNRGIASISDGGVYPGLHPEDRELPYKMGTLTMHIVSLHCFEGDLPKLRREYGTA